MGERESKRSTDEARRSLKRRRRAACDRLTAIVSISALLATVALLAVPVAVQTWWDPREHVPPRLGLGPQELARELDWARTLGDVVRVLAPGLSDPAPDATEMAARLGNLGSDAIPVVVGMLCGNIPAPRFAAGSVDQPIHPGALALRERALFLSVRQFRAKDVIAHLRFGAPDASYDERLVFARLLGEVGTLEAQDAILELLELFEPTELKSDQLANTIELALARCTTAEPAAVPYLSKSVPKLSPALLPIVARAVGRTRGPESAALLARMLGKSLDLDIVVLQELVRVTESSGIALDDGALSDVRRLLDHHDSRVARTAISVLGRLCDRESFGSIVVRLADSDRLVCGAAHWSLRAMARIDLGEGQDAWLDWLSAQEEWWNNQYPALCDDLASEDSGKVFAALSELSLHPFFKHDIARSIGPLANDSEPTIALTAIAALERIGSSQASPWLIEALSSGDDRRERAWKVLKALTGLDLALDHEAWASALP